MAERQNDSGAVILSFILGALVGGILGILFAPRSGKETRERIRSFLEEAAEKASELIEEGKEKAAEFVKEERKKIEEKFRPRHKKEEIS